MGSGQWNGDERRWNEKMVSEMGRFLVKTMRLRNYSSVRVFMDRSLPWRRKESLLRALLEVPDTSVVDGRPY
ncbi:hypothetical protein VNO77_19110 [Canavalia gladiata]|uniref:Uncharacterized protein n=1 Tax=Canavalia gladiata TaxID=3824 RepID=A0AAN9LQE4_CANGL